MKGLGGWASGFERLAEGSTVVEGGRVEVWAGVWEVVVVDRKVGSIFAGMRRLLQAVESCVRAGCDGYMRDIGLRKGLSRAATMDEGAYVAHGSTEMTAMASARNHLGQGIEGLRGRVG